jgi:hypothetical protein
MVYVGNATSGHNSTELSIGSGASSTDGSRDSPGWTEMEYDPHTPSGTVILTPPVEPRLTVEDPQSAHHLICGLTSFPGSLLDHLN